MGGEVPSSFAQGLLSGLALEALCEAAELPLRAHPATLESPRLRGVADVRPLRHGDTIDLGGSRLRAHATPGHAPGHLAFEWVERGALFTGDHVMGWSTSIISPPDGDMAAYLESLALLLKRNEGAYCPTHGAAITEPKKTFSFEASGVLIRQ